MHSGKLWTPEGFGFDPSDGAWWSLLVRQARGFRAEYERANALERTIEAQGAERRTGAAEVRGRSGRSAEPGPAGEAEGRRAAPALNLFLKHFPTRRGENTPLSLEKPVSSFAITSVANWSVVTNKGGVHG